MINNKKRKSLRLVYISKITLFVFVLLLLPTLSIFSKREKISYYENRVLSVFPVLDIRSDDFWSGKYFSQVDTYLVEHIFARDNFLKTLNNTEVNLLKRVQTNNVVTTNDGILLPFNKYFNLHTQKEKIGETFEVLETINNKCTELGITFLYVGVPEQSTVFLDLYPNYIDNRADIISENKKIFFDGLKERNIDFVNVGDSSSLEPNFVPSEYYHTTDHHFNLKGAFYAYQKIIEKLNNINTIDNIPVIDKSDLSFEKIDNPFLGSRSRKIFDVFNNDDVLLRHTNTSSPLSFERWDNGNKTESSVYRTSIDEKGFVSYTTYMGGDIAETIIRTNREKDGLGNVLLFGDSFTNGVEMFLYESFNETRSLDFRHYKEKDLLSYLDDYKPDVLICLRDNLTYFVAEGNGKPY